ncbi:MAG: hypothetical protein ACI9MR_002750, partial [Myxococcota bacterium]
AVYPGLNCRRSTLPAIWHRERSLGVGSLCSPTATAPVARPKAIPMKNALTIASLSAFLLVGCAEDKPSTTDTQSDSGLASDSSASDAPDAAADTGSTASGSTCAEAIVINPASFPVSFSGDTTGAGNSYSTELSPGGCWPDAPISGTKEVGENAEEQVYSFTPSVDGTYAFTVTPDGGFDPMLYVVTNCDDMVNSCVGAIDASIFTFATSPERLVLGLTAGTTYWVVVDHWGMENRTGAYTLEVRVPSCAGKSCGDDGTGLSCGDCASRHYCDVNNQCVAAQGDLCADAEDISGPLPVLAANKLELYTNDYGVLAPQCNAVTDLGTNSQDVTYLFTPSVSGDHMVTVTPTGVFRPVVYITTDCDNLEQGCDAVGWAKRSGEPAIMFADLTAGQNYYIIVDGLPNGAPGGGFDLAIEQCNRDCVGKSCGSNGCGGVCGPGCLHPQLCNASFECDAQPPGDTCADPIVQNGVGVITGSIETFHGDTTAAGCPDLPGGISFEQIENTADAVIAFTAQEAGSYRIKLDSPIVSWLLSGIYVLTDCDDQSTCVGAALDATGPEIALTLTMAAGETRYVVVDHSDPERTDDHLFTVSISLE